MLRTLSGARGGSQSPFELRTLAALPCGCIVADFQAPTLDVELVSIEARGPHCDIEDHRSGRVLALEESSVTDMPPPDMATIGRTAA